MKRYFVDVTAEVPAYLTIEAENEDEAVRKAEHRMFVDYEDVAYVRLNSIERAEETGETEGDET